MGPTSTIIAWHVGALGDLVLAIPALRMLRRVTGGRARVELLAVPRRGELLVAGGAAHAAHDGTRADLAPLFAAGGRAPAWLARLCESAKVVLFFRDAGALAAKFARAIAVAPRPFETATTHCADWLLDGIARALSVEPPPPEAAVRRPRLRVSALARERARARLASAGIRPGTKVLAIHPGSGGAAKSWPPERFLEVARRARRELGLEPLAILGPVEHDSAHGARALAALRELPRLDDLALPELAAVLSLAAVFLGNDSGPAHVAAAAGAPTVAIFGPASFPAIFAPRARSPHVPVATIVTPALEALEPARVLDAIARTLIRS